VQEAALAPIFVRARQASAEEEAEGVDFDALSSEFDEPASPT